MVEQQAFFFAEANAVPEDPTARGLLADLAAGTTPDRSPVQIDTFGRSGKVGPIPTFVDEFWTARQRAASSLHEVSYRACFKPALPRFFIDRLTEPGDVVLDPFAGRGTTVVEAAIHGRIGWGVDVNPLCRVLVEPRLRPPTLEQVEARLSELDLESEPGEWPEELLVFFHPDTLRELVNLRAWLLGRVAAGALDPIDAWIRMVAVNRLTGHSPGFFSVYTLPPNQAVSVDAQRKINLKRGQTPPRRDVRERILRKSKALLKDCDAELRVTLAGVADRCRVVTAEAAATGLPEGQAALVITSPPFLDVVQYQADNWLRCWFCGIDADAVAITHLRRLEDWEVAMTKALCDSATRLRPGGFVAFEVGEVRKGTIRLEESVLDCGRDAGLEPVAVMVHDQRFTKTANCWGIGNNSHGTNTNRIVLLQRPGRDSA